MFGFLKKQEEEKAPIKMRKAANLDAGCRIFHREMPDPDGGVFVEVAGEGDYKIYMSSFGVTPGYISESYDKWCRKSLLESYVFANMDTARMYFKDRKNEMLFHLSRAAQTNISL
jgi:hypothetical protein